MGRGVRRNGRRHASGFTLIELMIVVGIVGILSTVALPTFQRMVVRAKTAERATVMLRIKQAVQDYYIQNGRALPAGLGATTMDSGWNPAYGSGPSMVKQVPLENVAAWNYYFSAPNGGSSIKQELEGALYYRYYFRITEGTPSSLEIWAYGDLDGDGIVSTKYLQFQRSNGAYVPAPAPYTAESPAAGSEDLTTF